MGYLFYLFDSQQKLLFCFINQVNLMGNLHYRLNFDPGETNKIFHHSSKKYVKISRIAKFGCEML